MARKDKNDGVVSRAETHWILSTTEQRNPQPQGQLCASDRPKAAQRASGLGGPDRAQRRAGRPSEGRRARGRSRPCGASGSYRRDIQGAREASLILRAWEAAQQDLVMGGSVPQGEAHPQLGGVQGLHGDVGIPQTPCPGHRRAGSEERAGVPKQAPLAGPPAKLPALTHGLVFFILGSLQSADPEKK